MNLQRTEDEEQAAFVRWLNAQGYHFWHTPNSTYTKSWAQKNKNTRLGVQAGIPDIFVLANGKRIAVEMKRSKGGVVSEHQRKWLGRLAEYGFECAVCHGYDEAVEFVESVVGKQKVEI